MGYGSYSREAHEAITRTRANLPTQQVFTQRACHPLMDPKGVRVRECRDSPDHPRSIGIAFALDVTGSMGDIPDLIARRELPRFMAILEACAVEDPQVLFLAVGDATNDRAALQVGQFESSAELMDRWLTFSFLEGGGGVLGHESYELALYFLAQHTAMDCVEKRGKRGYLFMTGDEMPYPAVSKHQVEALIGDRIDQDLPAEAVIAKLARSYHPFFLIPDLKRRERCERTWRDLLGDHVVCMESPQDTCHVAAGLVALTEGVVPSLEALPPLLAATGTSHERIGAIVRALTPYAATLGRDGVPGPRVQAGAKPGDP